jgi:glycine/D-amino acid oxidase-like deaminating enzyme
MRGHGWCLPPTQVNHTQVIMVGAGIVNLMTAWRLAGAGYRIDIYDSGAGPVPALDPAANGCTLGGGNGRMFTLTEADIYNPSLSQHDPVLLSTPVSDGGWRAFPAQAWTIQEQHWAEQFHGIPPEISKRYESDLIELNRHAWDDWNVCIKQQPGLFKVSGLAMGILRLYANSESLAHAIERHRRIGGLRRILSVRQLAADYPSLAVAADAGEISGGIEVAGFTLGIYEFILNLSLLLEAQGVTFHWGHIVDRIEWARPGLAAGLRDRSGVLMKADHYVLSVGAYGHNLLNGTEAGRQIQGVAGVWITIPNAAPSLPLSLKLRRDGHATPDTNVTVIDDPVKGSVLVLGAGYGWIGANPENIDVAQLAALFNGIQDTARRFFPAAYRMAARDGWLRTTRRWCIRPWTATSLGVFEMCPTIAGGSLIVTGGHNTGGFAQAPVVGDAVLAALEGTAHPMHSYYDPRRSRHDLAALRAGHG